MHYRLRPRRLLPPMVNYRMVVLMLVTSFLGQMTIALARLATTYRALDAGLEGSLAGVLSAAFSVLPAVFVISFGRLYDRKGAGPGTLFGAGILAIAVLFLWWAPPSLIAYFFGLAILGIGQTLYFSGLQMVVMHASTKAHRDAILGNYLLALAAGEALAPLLASLAGSNDPAVVGRYLLLISFVSSVVLLLPSALVYIQAPKPRAKDVAEIIPVRKILFAPALFLIIMAGSVAATAKDLMTIYIPVMGVERGTDISTVGFMLAVLSISSAASRFGYGTISRLLGRTRLVTITALVGAVGLLVLVFPLPPPPIFAAMPLIGFSLGSCGTASLSLLLMVAPRQGRGAAMAIRQMGTRIGQLVFPLSFGAIAAVWGVGVIFGLLALATAGINLAAVNAARKAYPGVGGRGT